MAGLPTGLSPLCFPRERAGTQDGVTQTRGCTVGVDCNAALQCTTTAAPKCNPVNYLDVVNGVEDNAAFVDGNTVTSHERFCRGEIRDAKQPGHRQ